MFLFAPTVPSEPRPKNTARTVSGGSMSSEASYGRLVRGDVVVDPDREPPLGPLARQLLEHAGDHRRRELLRRQAVATADHARHRLALAVGVGLAQRREHVEEQRLAERARLLGAVEHGDAPHACRQRRDQLARRERAVQPDLRDADPLAARLQERDGLARGLPAGAHHHQHPLGLGWPL